MNVHVAKAASPNDSGGSSSELTMPTKVKDIIRRLEDDGWSLVAMKGSHRQFKHGMKAGRVTVPGKLSADLQPGTLKSILRQAALKD